LAYTEITEFTLPSEVDVGTQVELNLTVKLLSQPSGWSNLSIAFEYTYGESDSIEVYISGLYFEIPKGRQVVRSVPLPNVGEEVTFPITIKPIHFAGTYAMTAKAGHVDGEFSIDSYQTREMVVKSLAAPTPTPTTVDISSLLYPLVSIMVIFMMISLLRSLFE